MPNDVDWPDVVWNEINDAVITDSDLTIQEGSTKPFVEISRELELTGAQVSREGEKKTGKTLARMAAKGNRASPRTQSSFTR